ncbi:ribosome biogenesis GTPase Der [Pseudoclavibacter chungangensis]|uniref:GTPase Der n=1 Tax=Pseudoclavibacter chungangensis TaxID=587635 RepID=A0A7J5BQ39_9MICO|nr:ribosome biogenesis GTPase Der [Pseudoclavibacter chungangensis]KAB1653272.1 ribosome biogenesis GTPase Der [Pseudoclavibacter chungangensis]NYJ66959.1 GTP-binding protein [Pseudoclavibacter chungangensis]
MTDHETDRNDTEGVDGAERAGFAPDAPGAPTADELRQAVDAVDDEVADARAAALRQSLDDYELDDDDLDIIDAATEDADAITYLPALPVLAVVGRPNVGKSALVNRIIGRREAVVEDTPGVTRDRVSYKAEWNGRWFTLVDTGGWEPDAKGIDLSVAQQAEIAIELADAVLFVVDANVGATSTDEHVVKLLRKSDRPVLLVANKVDDLVQEPNAAQLWSLGLGEPWPVSALHGRGVADLLDKALSVLPEVSKVAKDEVDGPRRVAILGRPNVGKSSLLNKAAGEERVVVNDLAGTTRDPIDEQIELGGRVWRFVDTAGIRKKVHLQQGADFYASLRTTAALEKAEVAVVVIDVTQPIGVQDVRVVDLVLESGRALVLAFNKWDELDDERRWKLEREIEQDLAHVSWAPRVNISAKTGRHLEKLVPALETALESWDTRIPTGKFNAFLTELVQEFPHPLRGGKQPRILFGTQAATRPPTFVLFTTGFLDPGYRRFITRRLREVYGFVGTPIVVNMRVREKRQRR